MAAGLCGTSNILIPLSIAVARRLLLAGIMLTAFCAFGVSAGARAHPVCREHRCDSSLAGTLADSITRMVADCPGEIGVAVIVNGTDTVSINDRCVYPLMSVFKVHQALAVCEWCDRKGTALDSLLIIRKDELDPATWSPMREERSEPSFALSISDLLRYSLVQSDNNASNILFERLVNVEETDIFIARLIPRSCFRLVCTESEMAADHSKAGLNRTSPLGAAILMDKLFSETLVSRRKQDFIEECLRKCATGQDRIPAPLLGKTGVVIAHKTGSGYTENGILAASNDVAYIILPNGVHYSLAVFVKDFIGTEAEAARISARISAVVYSLLVQAMPNYRICDQYNQDNALPQQHVQHHH